MTHSDKRRYFVRGILVIGTFILLLTSCRSTLPKSADVSVIGIRLADPKSVSRILSDEVHLAESHPPSGFFYSNYCNSDCSQLLTLVQHPGSQRNSFSEMKVRKMSAGESSDSYRRLEIKEFMTGKKIKLGASPEEVLQILGRPDVNEKEETISVLKYKIMRNSSYSEFLKAYNMPIYYGNYRFVNNQLTEFSFGFEYP